MGDAENAETIPALWAAAVAAGGDRPALGAISGGQLSWQSWAELGETANRWAAALEELGVEPGDRVAQLGGNSAGWVLTDLAIQLAGGVHVPIHASLAAGQAAEQICHAEARIVVVPETGGELAAAVGGMLGGEVRVVDHAELESTGEGGAMPQALTAKPDDLATILYTSGTTGTPLGVMLTQRNLASNARAMSDMIAANQDEIRLGVLPLSHIYARTCDLYVWICRMSKFALCEARETLVRDCQLVRPTTINVVPYVYQKIADGARAAKVDAPGLRAMLGGELKRCYCGGAALAPEAEKFFAERGLPIMCGYGLSEAAPVVSMSNPENREAGSVGRPLSNLEVRLADDGEVQVRGPNVMPGYWKDPDATARAIVDGWLCTGDLGAWSETGNLKIVGRKKELLVLATGKKVAPTRIEQLLAGSPLIEQACVVGDGRKYLGALIVPSAEGRSQWGMGGTGVSPVLSGSGFTCETPVPLDVIRSEIDRVLADAADFEQVRAFVLLSRPFSTERGELTAKFSLRRKVIEDAFAAEIDCMYRAK